MDCFTIFRVLKGNIAGFFNYITINDKNRKDSTPRLFIDITEVHHHDYGTGVPRVTKNITENLYKMNLPYKLVKVYAKPHNEGFFNVENDKPIKVKKGDFFFGLDFSKFMIPKNVIHIKKMRKLGIPVWFFVHDLIPIKFPQYCTKSDIINFKKWINVVKTCDGYIANSKSTDEEMYQWLKEQPEKSWNKNIRHSYIHLACTFKKEAEVQENLEKTDKLQFLAVSTVEPRKRYDLIVGAFEKLWQEGQNATLHIVGKPGWNNQKVVDSIHTSKYYNSKLIWHENFISDEELDKLYRNSTALIFASDTEGFGVPVIEAAIHNKPLILRDIPIFHEVTDNQAFFFKGNSTEEFAKDLKEWIKLYNEHKILSPKIKIYTWYESTKETCNILFPNCFEKRNMENI